MAEDADLLRWNQVLSELESETELLARGREVGSIMSVSPWEAPELPPLPAILRDRVRDLITRQRALKRDFEIDLLEAQQDVDLSRPTSRVTSESPQAVLLDTRI